MFSSDSGIWVVGVDGRGLHKLLGDGRRPSWSPDGKWIAFISDRDGAWQLFKMRSDGSHVTKLINIDLRAPEATPDWGPRP